MTVSKPIWSLHGTWTRLAANDRLRRSSQALSIIRNTAYIFGGELQPRQPVDNRIDTVALTTSTKPTANPRPSSPLSLTPAPSPRVGAPSTTLQQSLYIFSGRGGTAMAPLDEAGAVWAFDTLASTWTLLTPADATAPCPPPRSYHCTASDGAHMLFIHAGCPASGRLNDLWAFDTRERTWRQCKDAPGPARGGASLAFSAGKLYRMNGFDGQAEVGGVVDEYNIATDSWRSNAFTADGKDGPEARSVCALVGLTIAGREKLVTLFGERDPSSLGHAGAGKMLGDVWLWDVGERWWTRVQPRAAREGEGVPEARGWFDADVWQGEEGGNGGVVVHGGLAEGNERLGDVWILRF